MRKSSLGYCTAMNVFFIIVTGFAALCACCNCDLIFK